MVHLCKWCRAFHDTGSPHNFRFSVKKAAAKARVAADKKRNVETPEWIKELSR